MVPHPATMATRASSSKGPWLNHLDGLSQQFDVLIEIDGLGDNDRRDKKFLKILRDICTVVHDAEKRAAPGLPEIVEEAYTVLAKLLKYAYTDGLFSFIQCFAYSDDNPLVRDSLKMAGTETSQTSRARHVS